MVLMDVLVPGEEAGRVGVKDEFDGGEGAVEGEVVEVGGEDLGGEGDSVGSWVERDVLVRAGKGKKKVRIEKGDRRKDALMR